MLKDNCNSRSTSKKGGTRERWARERVSTKEEGGGGGGGLMQSNCVQLRHTATNLCTAELHYKLHKHMYVYAYMYVCMYACACVRVFFFRILFM